MIIVCKGKSISHIYSRLRVAGLRVVVDENDEPTGRVEESCEMCATPPLVVADGDLVMTFMLPDSKANKIPQNDTPNFAVVWRSDIDTEETWPLFTVEEGQQAAGRII